MDTHVVKRIKGKIVHKKWILYGATGYTGRLIVAEAKKRGLNPIIAGRSKAALQKMHDETGFEYRCFELNSRQEIATQLDDCYLVLNCAGPFSQTARPMMAACLHSKSHYLDITGEIDIFEHGHLLSKSAEQAGVMICPGVGFDVVPTDCLAKALSEKLPDADSLWLGFSSNSRFSPGTAKTSVEGLAGGCRVRRDGYIMDVPLAYKVRKIDYGNESLTSTTIPWGDVSTAYYSTGIPNIDVYIPLPDAKIKQLKRIDKVRWIFKWGWLVNFMKKQIDKKVKGPSDEQLKTQRTEVWGEVINPAGNIVTGRISTANGYQVTVEASLAIVEHLLSTEPAAGFKTPSLLMGADFIEKLPSSTEFKWQTTQD